MRNDAINFDLPNVWRLVPFSIVSDVGQRQLVGNLAQLANNSFVYINHNASDDFASTLTKPPCFLSPASDRWRLSQRSVIRPWTRSSLAFSDVCLMKLQVTEVDHRISQLAYGKAFAQMGIHH